MKKNLLCILLLFSSVLLWGQGLKTQGKLIVDQSGKQVILKGMGLGGWMLMEGYMMQSSDVADTQHEFRKRLIELMGEQKTDEFFQAWLDNHVTKKDIDSLAKWGYNSIRLPMHYNLFTLPIEDEPVAGDNTWLNRGFDMVDNLLQWCESNQIYLILDLHAAPGGQGANAAISDYDPTKPSLWESDANKAKTVALWKKLAERYKDEPWIGGYDLLNEVNWTLPGNTALKELYMEITQNIRSVDKNHIIFIEGNSFANDFTGLTPAWDDNMAYSFHKYWSYNDQGSIQWVLDIREKHNVPLWMGEAGENSNVWFHDAIKLFEDNGIGWSWWPMKRIETIVSPFSIKFTQGYKDILGYWRGENSKPSEANAYAAMMELATNTNSENCLYQKDVPDAHIRQTNTDETIPYSQHNIPGVLYMSDYDMGKANIAYYDKDNANYSLATGEFQAWNAGWVYRNDGVDIETNKDAINSNGFHIGFVNKGEWINYTVQIAETAVYKLSARIATQEVGGQFHLSLNGEDVTSSQTTTATGGWTQFATQEIENVLLEQGEHILTFHVDGTTSFNISSIAFEKTGAANTLVFNALSGVTTEDDKSIEIGLNAPVKTATVPGSKEQFSVQVNGVEQTINYISVSATKPKTLKLTLGNALRFSDDIQLSYAGTGIQSTYDKTLEAFSNLPVRNILPVRSVLPTRIEAENFDFMVGLATEETTDDGGGENIGYTDAGDYADYLIIVDNEGAYELSLRLAAQYQEGSIGFYLVAADGTETPLVTVTSPVTGGWQTWQTVSENLNLPKGSHLLRMRIETGGFNMNWMEFNYPDSDHDGVNDREDICPNTPSNTTVDAKGCAIFDLPANNFTLQTASETCQSSNNGSITITAASEFNYTATLAGNRNTTETFTSDLAFTDLEAGTYSVCITIEDQPDFKQCFTAVVQEPENLSVLSVANKSERTVKLSLKGANQYFIRLNDTYFTTSESEITLDLKQKTNTLSVKTDLDCQGIYEENILLTEQPMVYPNPVTDNQLFINMGAPQESSISAYLFDITGKLIFSKVYSKTHNGFIEMDLSKIPNHIFMLKIIAEENTFNYKIIK